MIRRILWSLIYCVATAAAQPAFDVASIKRHDPQDRTFNPPTCANGRFLSRLMPVQEVLTWAYDLRMDQFAALETSLVTWARYEPYDIEATFASPFTDAQCKQMVRQLLADRFQMKSHWQTK